VTNAVAPPAWNNADVDVKLEPDDALSRVAATSYKVDGGAPQPYNSGSSISFHDEGVHTLEYWSVDAAGNEETHHQVPVRIDKTSPTIFHSLSPAPNANGWNKSDVTVHFVCDDALSGIESCTDDKVVATEGANQVVKGTALDRAGNSVDDPAQVSLDKTAPTIAASVDRAANANGWYNDNVVVSFVCGDALSGVDVCPGDQTLGEGGNQSASGTATDAAGNTASDGVSGINVDKTAPTISGKPAQAANANGWHKDDVTINWTCFDALSGLDGACPADSTITGEGDNLGATESVLDKAGNQGTDSVSGIKIDRTPPSTHADLPDPVQDSGGWYAGPTTITLGGVDSLSGIDATYYKVDGGATQTYSGPFSFDQNGKHTIRFWSTDKAGNVEDETAPGHAVEVKIDTVNPSTSGSPVMPANANGWYNKPVDVSFNCSDDDSGLKSCTQPVTLSDEGANQSVKGTAEDLVGNTASDTVSGINIDLTAPTVSGKPTQAPNANGWYKGDVAINWTCSDALSGLDGACPPDSTITGEGSNLGAGPVSVSDKAGNVGQGSVSGVKVDRHGPSAPTASFGRSPEDATGNWFKESVTVSYSGSTDPKLADGSDGSGVAGYTAAQTFNTSGSHAYSGKATDKAGNDSEAASGTVKVDADNPSLQVSGCPSTNVTLGSSQSLSVTASDGESGLKSNPSGSVPLDTSSVGSHSKTVEAEDNVGHKVSKSCAYSVEYKFDGFSAPVDNGGVLNAAKAGQGIPLKWRLLDANNSPVTNLASVNVKVTVTSLGCTLGTTTDALEEYAAGSSGLQNLGNGYYQFNWKSPTTYANSCKTLNLDLGEAAPRTALFKFTK
jgi:hypothetical protein